MTEKDHPWRWRGPTLSPCKDCGERVLGCHDSCDYYAEYKARLSMRAEHREQTVDADVVTIENIQRIRKDQRRRRR